MGDPRTRVVLAAGSLAVLATGVVLGSGPLRTALLGGTGDTVDQLQSDLAAAEAARDAADEQTIAAWEYLDAAGATALAGSLADVDVLLVGVDPAASPFDSDVTRHVTLASGTVAGVVETAAGWADSASAPFREALAEQLEGTLVGVDDATHEELLAHAFVQGATGAAPTGTDRLDVEAAGTDRGVVVWDLLTQAELVEGDAAESVDVVVVVAGTADADVLVDAFAAYDAPVIVVGPAAATGIYQDRDDIATVVDGDGWPWSVTTAAAVTEVLRGAVPHYADGEIPAVLAGVGAPEGADG